MILVSWILILCLSLILLVKSSDLFTDSAEDIGLSMRLPAFIVGITIVSVGTSLPELLTALFAIKAGTTEIVIGDVIGSNVTNIFLGLGVLPLIIGYFTINKNLISVDLPILLGSSFLIAATCYDGVFTRIEALFALAGFFIYMKYAISEHKEYKKKLEEEQAKTPKIKPKTIFILIISCVLLYFSAEYTVISIIKISEMINIGTEVVAASIVALGTSLPEIMASVVSAKKGNIDIAVGTLLGSNIFNAFAIMGISGLTGTLAIPDNMVRYGIGMLIMATMLYFFITLDREITKFEGSLLIVFYGLFIGKLFNFF
jgi:cation:H+ antiporter